LTISIANEFFFISHLTYAFEKGGVTESESKFCHHASFVRLSRFENSAQGGRKAWLNGKTPTSGLPAGAW
jgi:hypothetical protein